MNKQAALDRIKTATNETIDYAKSVDGSKVALTGGITMCGGYVVTGIGIAAGSTTACAVGIGAIYAGIGIGLGGLIKAAYDEANKE